MQEYSCLKPAARAPAWGVCLLTVIVQCCAVTAGPNTVPPFSIVAYGIQGGVLNASINSVTGCVYTLQAADSPQGYWTEITNRVGDGGILSFSSTTGAVTGFYRVAGLPAHMLAFFPSVPSLSSGAVSLPDATVGIDYSATLTPGSTGSGPYSLQVSNSPPEGLTAVVLSNNTVNALVLLSAAGTNLIANQRGQFTVTVKDAAGATLSRAYDVRVVAPAPQILTTQITFKAGVTTNVALVATNGTAPLTWSLLSGQLSAGVSLSTNGSCGGTPTVDAAELNETGLYTNILQVADRYTDRVTGEMKARTAPQTITQLVRLSYHLNILPDRPGGPYLQGICLECHGPGFPPDFSASSASAVIYVYAGSGGICSPYFQYIVPKDTNDSLIYLKLTDPPCGNRMPYGGPYFDSARINRLARWILELSYGDTD
jgi:hypothetical protein